MSARQYLCCVGVFVAGAVFGSVTKKNYQTQQQVSIPKTLDTLTVVRPTGKYLVDEPDPKPELITTNLHIYRTVGDEQFTRSDRPVTKRWVIKLQGSEYVYYAEEVE